MKKTLLATGLALSLLFPSLAKAQELSPVQVEQEKKSLVDIIVEKPQHEEEKTWDMTAIRLSQNIVQKEYETQEQTMSEHLAQLPTEVLAQMNWWRVDNRVSFYFSKRRIDFLMNEFENLYDALELDEQTRETIQGAPDILLTGFIMAESLGKVHAKSRYADGVFQFKVAAPRGKPSTWDIYKSSNKAQPQDPHEAYLAHIKYMSEAINKFDDILRAIASYNTGLNRNALRQRGSRKTYWEIDHKLWNETQIYVPRILAAIELLTNAKIYEIDPKELYNIFTETSEKTSITLDVPVHLSAIADALHADVRNLINLNVRNGDKIRNEKAWIYPGEELVLPVDVENRFYRYFDRDKGKFTERGYLANLCADAVFKLKDPSRETPYTIEPRDTLSLIATKFSKINDCRYTVGMLVEYNDIRNPNIIQPKQEIIIPPCGWFD